MCGNEETMPDFRWKCYKSYKPVMQSERPSTHNPLHKYVSFTGIDVGGSVCDMVDSDKNNYLF